MESILLSIKKLLGISEDDTSFDIDLILHINSVFFELCQMGIGPKKPFTIEDEDTPWTNFIQTTEYESVKTYVYLKVKLLFDPPTNSAAMESFKRSIDMYEWRLNFAAENSDA